MAAVAEHAEAYQAEIDRRWKATINGRRVKLLNELRVLDLETARRAPVTVARRLFTVTGFDRYAEEEGFLAHSPGAHVPVPSRLRAPRLVWTATK